MLYFLTIYKQLLLLYEKIKRKNKNSILYEIIDIFSKREILE